MTSEEIESKAKEYADRAWSTLGVEFNEDHTTFENIIFDAFIAGAEYERSELLRWRDPKEELPDDTEYVLIKTTMCRNYAIAFFKKNGLPNYRWHENNGPIDDDMVVGWRPIHELKKH